MGQKSVAILDIRSWSVTAVIGRQGVNNTFIFKGSQSRTYDGYEEGRFYDEKALKQAVYTAFSAAEQSAGERLKTVWVGVPDEFTKIVNKKHLVSFSSPKRIGEGDKETLFKDGYGTVDEPNYENIHSSALYFTTSDSRRVIDPVGIVSSTLEANICYVLCNVRFLSLMREMLTEYGFATIRFVPSSYMQATYLLSEEKRRASAILLDVGMASSSVSVFYGDGILRQSSFHFGEGDVIAALCTRLDLEYDSAVESLKKANLFCHSAPQTRPLYPDERYLSPERINEIITERLDLLCEPLSRFLDELPAPALNRPLLITGEGITGIRGAVEHISKRINRESEVLTPKLPYYNTPAMSSRISLLSYALGEKSKNKKSIFYRILNGFGG